MGNQSGPQTEPVDWLDLVRGVQRGEESATTTLYGLVSNGIRYLFVRQLGPDEAQDKLQDVMCIVIEAIRNGDLRQPECLAGFIRTIIRRQVAAHIRRKVFSREAERPLRCEVADRRLNPYELAEREEKMTRLAGVLKQLSDRDRDILVRYYLYEHSQAEICKDLGLSERTFQLLKTRAKARCGSIGKKAFLHKATTA